MDGSSRQGVDPAPEEMRAIGYELVDWIVDRAAELQTSPVADLDELDVLLAEVDEAVPELPSSVADSLDFLSERVVPHMTRTNHPGFHAYIPAPGSFYGALGSFIGAMLNPFAGSSLGGATFSALELVTMRWIAEAIGYPSAAAGIFTSGGSMANLGALAAARATREDWKSSVVFVSEQGHASMEKAAGVLGFAPDQIERLPTADDFRLIPSTVGERIRAVRCRRADAALSECQCRDNQYRFDRSAQRPGRCLCRGGCVVPCRWCVRGFCRHHRPRQRSARRHGTRRFLDAGPAQMAVHPDGVRLPVRQSSWWARERLRRSWRLPEGCFHQRGQLLRPRSRAQPARQRAPGLAAHEDGRPCRTTQRNRHRSGPGLARRAADRSGAAVRAGASRAVGHHVPAAGRAG